MYKLKCISAVLLAVSLLSGCSAKKEPAPDISDTAPVSPVPVTTLQDGQEEEQPATNEDGIITMTEPQNLEETSDTGSDGTISFVAVGDNLIHTAVYRSAAEHTENGGL